MEGRDAEDNTICQATALLSCRISTSVVILLSLSDVQLLDRREVFNDRDLPNRHGRKQGLLRHMRHKQDSLANRALLDSPLVPAPASWTK